MPRPLSQIHPDKFARYRATKRNRGLKMVRLWLPDTSAPGFGEEAARQARLTLGDADSAEALAFIECVAAWPIEPYDWGPAGVPGAAVAK